MNSHREARRGMEQENHYRDLWRMAALSFAAMYILMYAMEDTTRHVYMHFNQVYMAGLMTAPMIAIELCVMRAMYRDGRRNAVIIGASVIAGIAMFVLIRQQTAIRSAVPAFDDSASFGLTPHVPGRVDPGR